jgi:hypothetical protein
MSHESRTDTTKLPVPTDPDVNAPVRATTVADQWISVPGEWWNGELDRLRLPARPLELSVQDERQGLSRRDVWRHADAALADDEALLGLLLHSLAWGAGHRLRLCRKRLESVADDVAATVAVLRQAAEISRSDPVAAYSTLYPGGGAAIRWLGPAFGTKFLYFAGGGNPNHPSLILDSQVATVLHRRGWTSLRSGGRWPATTYGRYCDLLRRWATEMSHGGNKPTAPDQLEHWLFAEA